MKYCTNCGAALEDSTASFCAECGKPLSPASGDSVKNAVENKKAKHKEQKKPKKEKTKKQKKTKNKDEILEEIVGEPVDDGYDDVIPPDTDRVKEGLDKELIKKIVALSIGVIFIISMCVVMLYVL